MKLVNLVLAEAERRSWGQGYRVFPGFQGVSGTLMAGPAGAQALHAAGVVHPDVKLVNLVLAEAERRSWGQGYRVFPGFQNVSGTLMAGPAGAQALHAAGVVHRDVKPLNLVLAEAERRFKLIDLGAAADLRNGTNYAPDESILDPSYCPPEQCAPVPCPSEPP